LGFFQADGLHLADYSFLDGIADCVARLLALAGHEVLCPLSGKVKTGAVVYKLNPEQSVATSKSIVTERI
jgi:hypothetical protein